MRVQRSCSPARSPPLPGLDEWREIQAALRPYEIATLYVNLVLGRKTPHNLDACRPVWATAHR